MPKNEIENDLEESIDFPEVKELTTEDMQDSVMQTITPAQRRIVHLYISGGVTIKDIASLLGVTQGHVRNVLRNPLVKEAITQIQNEEDEVVKQGIKALRMKAMKKMNDLMDSRQDAIAYQAARDILDRTGHKGTVKQEVNVNITFEQQLKQMLDEAKDVIEIDDYEVKQDE